MRRIYSGRFRKLVCKEADAIKTWAEFSLLSYAETHLYMPTKSEYSKKPVDAS
ncbi:MAG: hypothetical protein ACI3Y2_02285 [Candidatus Egerieousia sp.]